MSSLNVFLRYKHTKKTEKTSVLGVFFKYKYTTKTETQVRLLCLSSYYLPMGKRSLPWCGALVYAGIILYIVYAGIS